MESQACRQFINTPQNAYRPLACKPFIVNSQEVGETGFANRLEFFFLTKRNTIREHATLDLLFPIPEFIRQANLPKLDDVRVTEGGNIRIIDLGLIRVIEN